MYRLVHAHDHLVPREDFNEEYVDLFLHSLSLNGAVLKNDCSDVFRLCRTKQSSHSVEMKIISSRLRGEHNSSL